MVLTGSCNGQDILTQGSFTKPDGVLPILETDSRTLSWIHPGKPWASYTGKHYGLQTDAFNGFRNISTIPEPGFPAKTGGAEQGEYTISRGADPADRSKKAFMHKVSSTWDQWDPTNNHTSRSEFYGGTLRSDVILEGEDYWIALAYRFDTDCFGHSGHNIDLADIHEQNWTPATPGYGVTGGVMNAMFLDDATATKWYWRNRWCTSYPPVNPALSENLDVVVAPVANTWYYVIRKVKIHWDEIQSPYSKVWVAAGTGTLVLGDSRKGPNGYNLDNPYYTPKAGIYKWDQNWGSKSTRTIWTKGLYVFKATAPAGDEPVIDENLLLAFLRSI